MSRACLTVDMIGDPVPLMLRRASSGEWNPLTEDSHLGTLCQLSERSTDDSRARTVERIDRIRRSERREA